MVSNTASGDGVFGNATTGRGVVGASEGGIGVQGNASEGQGVVGVSATKAGVEGRARAMLGCGEKPWRRLGQEENFITTAAGT